MFRIHLLVCGHGHLFCTIRHRFLLESNTLEHTRLDFPRIARLAFQTFPWEVRRYVVLTRVQ